MPWLGLDPWEATLKNIAAAVSGIPEIVPINTHMFEFREWLNESRVFDAI